MMASKPVGWGILGASWIGDRAVLPALAASRNGRLVAIASRDRGRAADQARRHGIPTVHETYEQLLADSRVEAVYVPLVNSLHRKWSLAALAAGKHVLCEKPLAVSVADAEEMVAAAERSGGRLMEALMYRFHPRMRALRARITDPVFVHASFGFPLRDRGNHRLRRALGGGALLDIGTYTLSVARWFLGEPTAASAVWEGGGGAGPDDGVDLSVAMSLRFDAGQASLWCSFDSPEHQELVVVARGGVVRVEQPFTAWRDPHDPYQLMVEEFADCVLDQDLELPVSPAESIRNLRAVEMVRGGAAEGS